MRLKKLVKWNKRQLSWDKTTAQLIFLLGPWVSFFVVEILNGNDVFTDLQLWQVGMNLIWYYILFVLLRLIFGRLRWAASAGMIISFAIGLTNHYILRFRGRILFPADLAGWKTAANVADAFDYSKDVAMVQAAIVMVAYLFLVYVSKPQKKRVSIKPVISIATLVLITGYIVAFFGTNMLPKMGIYTQQWMTQGNGFVLNFTVALRYSSVDKPDGYSEEAVLELLEQYPVTNGDSDAIRPENIVVIMNESFADFTIFDSFESNEDPSPFLHSLTENTTKGIMYAPVTGGGTASVEFEYLTGFSTAFQPPHTVAYQLYTKEGMPSLPQITGSEGYDNTAFHPYRSSGWNRPIAYENLSFDHQLYQEDVKDSMLVRGYISDESSYQTVISATEEAKGVPSFVFNVTMQNHSGYNQGWRNLDKSITLPENLAETDDGAEQYFSLVRSSDEALERMIAHYSAVDEPTMVVFFGDHQPPLKNAFYEELFGKKISELTTEETMQRYAVPFFIWTNYDTEEREDVVISPNFLGALTAEMAGLPMTSYMNFLMEMYKEFPAISPVGCITAEGEYVKKEEFTEEQAKRMREYEMLNYCGMVDLFPEAEKHYLIH